MIERREFIKSGIAVVGAGALLAAGRAAVYAADSAAGAVKPSEAGAYGVMTPVLSGCINAGNECLSHCIDLLGKGVTDLAQCADKVRTMLAVCNATAVLVTTTSPRTRAALDLCRDVCADCEVECRKHADKHPVCKACGDACVATVAKIRSLLA